MTVRVGIIGAGTMGRAHALTILRQVKGASVVCVCEPSEANRNVLRVEMPDVAAVSNPDELISASDVDAVIIASPDSTHEEFTLSCLRRAKPVLCEKPLAETTEACRRIIALEEENGTGLVTVGFMRRFDPAYVRLRAEMRAKTVGDVRLVRCIHRNKAAPGSFAATMGITNAMVHEFDILRWLTGAEPMEVAVVTPGVVGELLDPVLATIAMSDGTMAQVEVFMNARYGYDIRTEVLGADGILNMASQPLVQTGTQVGLIASQHQDFVERFADAYRIMLSEWVEGVRSGDSAGNAASAVDGLRAVQVAEAAVEALRSGRRTTVPPMGFQEIAGIER